MRRLSINRRIAVFLLGLVVALAAMVWLEQRGVRREALGITLLGITVLIYTCIGVVCRTSEPLQYYAAGRNVLPIHNGMAAAADWMSAASFISLMGTIYATGYSASALLLGWTGGFCLVAFFVAPYLRRTGALTLPGYFEHRYGGTAIYWLATLSVLACSFVYVVAQIYAVGLISSRVLGVDFVLGISLALGSVLLCSFLGGMRAITWTQVIQYVLMLFSVVVLLGGLLAKNFAETTQSMTYFEKIDLLSAYEQKIADDPAEGEVKRLLQRERNELAHKLQIPQLALQIEKERLSAQLKQLKNGNASTYQIVNTERQLRLLATDADRVLQKWRTQHDVLVQRLADLNVGYAMLGQAQNGAPQSSQSALNVMALIFVLSMGTASMPHLLMRFQTTASVAATRSSVSWALFFILLLYLCLPVLAVFVKLEVLTQLVGQSFEALPSWLRQWARYVPDLVNLSDVNGDGVLQWSELVLSSDSVMLILPELVGLPYALTALVAAGALAAALSTADGLLLAMTAVLSRDLLAQKQVSDETVPRRSLIRSKLTLLIVTLVASYVAAQRPEAIVTLVTTAFVLAAATFFVPLVGGIFWPSANRYGALAAMATGAVVALWGICAPSSLLLQIGQDAMVYGLVGVFCSVLMMVVVSLLTRNIRLPK